MLVELEIQNLILIEKAHIELKNGLHVFSGETGAGKTAIMQALALILGSRTDLSLIRKGEKAGRVKAHFTFSKHSNVFQQLTELGFDVDASEELIIERELTIEGKSYSKINQQKASLYTLKQIGPSLIQIVSQHAATELMQPSQHQTVLDAFGSLKNHTDEIAILYDQIESLKKDLESLEQQALLQKDLIKTYETHFEEIESAEIKSPQEEEELFSEYQNLINAKEKHFDLQSTTFDLYEKDQSLYFLLQTQLKRLEKWTSIDPSIQNEANSLKASIEELKELSLSLMHKRDETEENPERLFYVEERLALLDQLKKKHGPTLLDVLNYFEVLKEKLDPSFSYEEKIQGLKNQLKELETQYQTRATDLTQKRILSKKSLEKEIQKLFEKLELQRAKLSVEITPKARSRFGVDAIEFFLQANVGERPAPFKSRVSGGELSRVLLALKLLTIQKSQETTWIFDEIDSNLGGETASKLGQLLKETSLNHQILLITHLPQVALHADVHFAIEKHMKAKRTLSTLTLLDEQHRIQEIERMLGGKSMSQKTKDLAKALVQKED